MKKVCPKSGIKIIESASNITSSSTSYPNSNPNPNPSPNSISNSYPYPSSNSSANFNPYQNSNMNSFSIQDFSNRKFIPNINTSNIDLDIDNYSCDDLFNLLGIRGRTLDEELMKNVKRVVLKTHPDKSKLPSDYYIFFSKAYNRLHAIYITQNKATKNSNNMNTEYSTNYSDEKAKLLNNFFEKNKDFKNSNNFNKWFNEKFEKHHIKEEDTGYGDWLKSNDGIIETEKISQSQLGSEMEKHKKRLQGIIPYKGVQDTFSSSSILSGDGFSDLKHVYEESVIPVTQSDYEKIKKFNSINEFTSFRDREQMNNKPMNKKQAELAIKKNHRELEDQCVAMAFQNVKQSEKQQQQDNLFWSDLKRLT